MSSACAGWAFHSETVNSEHQPRCQVTPKEKKVALAIEVDATFLRPAWPADTRTGQVRGLGQILRLFAEELDCVCDGNNTPCHSGIRAESMLVM